MKTVITAGLDQDQINELKGDFKASLALRLRLQKVLEDKVQEHFKAQYNRDGYESPNWTAMQADSMGYIRGLREVIALLDDGKRVAIQQRPQGRPSVSSYKPKSLI